MTGLIRLNFYVIIIIDVLYTKYKDLSKDLGKFLYFLLIFSLIRSDIINKNKNKKKVGVEYHKKFFGIYHGSGRKLALKSEKAPKTLRVTLGFSCLFM